MFENKVIKGIHISRYIASWIRARGRLSNFDEWLMQLEIDGEKLTEEEIQDIWNFACCGKLELESDARKFVIGTK